MKTLVTMVAFLFTLLASDALAVPARQSRDMKLPSQQMIEKQTFTNPAAASANNVLSANAGATSAATVTVSSFAAQPDMPRNLVITPAGTTDDVAACVIVVNGTDWRDQSISENFTFADNASTATTGSKAFKSVSSVVFPANCEDGGFAATWSIGQGEKLGLKNCLAQAGHILFSTLNGAKEATAPTMAASASARSGNTADFNGAMNGSNDFELFYIQNFACP